MRDFEQDIRPGIGLGALVLGLRQPEVRRLLGDPSSESSEDLGGSISDNWHYDALALFLSFHKDDDYVLGTITTENPSARLHGDRIVGLSESELLAGEFGGLGAPDPDDDFGEFGRDYLWSEVSLSCWVRAEDSLVDSVSIMPLYDETGTIPAWPDRGV